MKVVGVVCSPRTGGNTEILVKEALAGAEDAGSSVELITLANKAIALCDACRSCLKTGECHFKDDMMEIYKKFQEADGIILGTPVYFLNVSAQAKLLIDRTYAFLWTRKLRGKVGGVIAVARRMGGSNVLSFLYTFLIAQRMVVAGGTVGYEGEELPYGEKGAIKRDESAMRESRAVGRNVVKLIESLTRQ